MKHVVFHTNRLPLDLDTFFDYKEYLYNLFDEEFDELGDWQLCYESYCEHKEQFSKIVRGCRIEDHFRRIFCNLPKLQTIESTQCETLVCLRDIGEETLISTSYEAHTPNYLMKMLQAASELGLAIKAVRAVGLEEIEDGVSDWLRKTINPSLVTVRTLDLSFMSWEEAESRDVLLRELLSVAPKVGMTTFVIRIWR